METILRQLEEIQNRKIQGELTLTMIQKILGEPFSLRNFQRFTLFKEQKYQRNTVLWYPTFELVCICWLPGQASSIHSHGVTSGGMRVVQGSVFEENYSNAHEKPLNRVIHEVGRCGWVTPNTLHRVGNASNSPAVTIHLYSPPFQTAAVPQTLPKVVAA